jgi:hypothetical protein
MDIKASFIGQISDTILRLIFPKNFYDLRQAIPPIIVDITPSWRTQKNEE